MIFVHIYIRGLGVSFKLVNIKSHDDDRGSLISLESSKEVPFDIKRVYYLYNCNSEKRGFHAHRNLKQFIICVSGSCSIKFVGSHGEAHYKLDSPTVGVSLSGIVWREIYNFTSDAVLLVLASDFYDDSDYIHSYSEFVEMVKLYDS